MNITQTVSKLIIKPLSKTLWSQRAVLKKIFRFRYLYTGKGYQTPKHDFWPRLNKSLSTVKVPTNGTFQTGIVTWYLLYDTEQTMLLFIKPTHCKFWMEFT